jgi:hypothetical protein
MIDDIVRQQLIDKYTTVELVEALNLDIDVFIDDFEYFIEDNLDILLDKQRGIGL